MERRSPGNPRRSCRRPGIPGPPCYLTPRIPTFLVFLADDSKTVSSSKPVLPNPSSPSLPIKVPGSARKFAEKREREREEHGAKKGRQRGVGHAMLVSRSSSPMRLAGERARDKDGERRRAQWGKREANREAYVVISRWMLRDQ